MTRPASLKVRALQWLAQREHSPAELRAKLMRAAAARASAPPGHPQAQAPGASAGTAAVPLRAVRVRRPAAEHAAATAAAPISPEAEVDALIAWLDDHGHLSAQRFVESRVHLRQARHGQQRIERELRQHGLALDPAQREALQATEHQRALAVWQRKYGATATDAAGRVRQMRFLVGRGFSPDVVRRIVRAGQAEPDDDGQAPADD